MSVSSIEEQITSAFLDVPAPPSWSLTQGSEGQEPLLVREAFQDKHDWRDVDAGFLDLAPDGLSSALSFFSDEAFRFFLPAYLVADLRDQLHNVDVLFHLVHGLDDTSKDELVNPIRYGSRTWYDEALHRFAIFDPAQVLAISEYLQHKLATSASELDRTITRQALERYWLPRARTVT